MSDNYKLIIMTAIKHLVTIKTNPEKVYQAVTTQKGISAWWCKNTTAKPEIGFVNIFIFGSFRNESIKLDTKHKGGMAMRQLY